MTNVLSFSEEKLQNMPAGSQYVAGGNVSHEVIGHVDSVGKGRVTGWACDKKNMQAPVQVVVAINNKIVASGAANKFRSDLKEAGYGNGRHGFDIPLPEGVVAGGKSVISVRAENGLAELTGSPIIMQDDFESSAFLDSAARSLVGWARWKGKISDKVGVSVIVDGKKLADIIADVPVRGLGGVKVPGASCGFAFPIPAVFLDYREHVAEIVATATGKPLGSGPFSFRLSPPEVSVSLVHVNGRVLCGKVTNPQKSDESVTLGVRINDHDFGTIVPNKSRAAYAASSLGDRKKDHFFLRLPVSDAEQQEVAITFFLADDESQKPVAHWEIAWDGQCSSHLLSLPSDAADAGENADVEARYAEISKNFAKILKNHSEYFDEDWYLLAYPDAARAVRDKRVKNAIAHYTSAGIKLAYSPHPLFDERWYRANHPVIGKAVRDGKLPCAFAYFVAAQGSQSFWSEKLADAKAVLHPVVSRAQSDVAARSAYEVRKRRIMDVMSGRSRTVYGDYIRKLVADSPEQDLQATLAEQEQQLGLEALQQDNAAPAPLVSVIMPTFNRAYTIAEAVQSVLDQSYENWELLVCDDGSFDKTSLVMSQFDDPRIRYLPFQKSNGAVTRNKGLRFARGEFISYLDSDNLWHPLFLDIMIGRLRNKPWQPIAYAGYIDTETVGTQIRLEGLKVQEFDAIQLINRNFIDLNTLVHRVELTRWMGAFRESLPRLQDWDLMLRYTSIFHPHVVQHYLAFYRRNVAWGQVTHLFAHQDIMGDVREKTRQRLEESHVSLSIPWKRMPSLAIVSDGSHTATVFARSIGALLDDIATVRIYEPRLQDRTEKSLKAFEPSQIPIRHYGIAGQHWQPWHPAEHLSTIVSEENVLLCGFNQEISRSIADRLPAGKVFRLEKQGAALAIVGADDSEAQFALGHIPLPLAEKSAKAESKAADRGQDGVLIIHTEQQPVDFKALGKFLTKKKGPAVPVTVTGDRPLLDPWIALTGDKYERQETSPDLSLRGFSKLICLTPVEDLSPEAFLLVVHALGAGKIVVLPPIGHSDLWGRARTVYAAHRTDWPWLFDKLGKLDNDKVVKESLSENARTLFNTIFHPELTKERLKYFLAQS